jgi:hypothetical protein
MRRSWSVLGFIATFLVIITFIVLSLGTIPTISNAQGGFPTNTPNPLDVPEVPLVRVTNTPIVVASPTLVGPYEYPENYNPLTGLPYPNEEARNRRNLIVKISNYPPVVRPQHGLNEADIVFEYEAEGGVTRFAAIYRSQSPGRVGSVRSARLVDLELVGMYQALLAYSGSNDWIRNYILNAEWRWWAISPHLQNYPCPTFCRYPEGEKAFEHTLFGDTDGIWAEAEEIDVNQGMQATGLAFSDMPDPNGVPMEDIYVDWYAPTEDLRWQYNAADGKYYRWGSGLPHLDATTGAQVAVDNVVLLEVWHVDRPDVYESEVGGIALEHQLWGYSRAWVFRDGLWYEGWWYRNRDYGALQLRYDYRDRATPMHLKPGRTWFVIVRKTSAYQTSGPMFSVTTSETKVDAVATAEVVMATQTAVWQATATQRAEWYGTPTPSATLTTPPSLTPQP